MEMMRVLSRYDDVDRAVRGAAGFVAKYGVGAAIIEDRDFANGGGDAYPYAVVTPYVYQKGGRYVRP